MNGAEIWESYQKSGYSRDYVPKYTFFVNVFVCEYNLYFQPLCNSFFQNKLFAFFNTNSREKPVVTVFHINNKQTKNSPIYHAMQNFCQFNAVCTACTCMYSGFVDAVVE